jgi:excisionase family DNA binding protein
MQSQISDAAEAAATGKEKKHQHRFLTVAEVAALLQVPVSWIYGRLRERSTKPLPGYRVGKYWRFREPEIIAWVEGHKRGSHGT